MAKIVIKDLPDNIELDRAAMRAISGGARRRGSALLPAQTILRNTRIVDYPPGVNRTLPAAKNRSSK